jgi:hypothetical protein
MEAGKRDITSIFNQARTLEIPFFQRAYVWKEEDWERFTDDMIAENSRRQGYFLGSIILKQKETESSDVGDTRIVVDGQQRLTSLVLLFRVVCDVTGQPGLFNRLFRNLKDRLVLQHNHNDIEVFETLASGRALNEDQLSKYAHNNVLGLFRYLRSREPELGNIDPMAIVNHVYFVGIDLGKDEDEQQIFDTINSLGVDLTTAELLKNELYERSQLEFFKETWLQAFEESETTKQYWALEVTAGRARRQNVDLFLQSFLLNQPGVSDDVRVGKLFAEFRSYFQRSEVDKAGFAIELSASAQLYQEHIQPGLLEEAISMQDAMERMNVAIFGLQTTTVLPYILHILQVAADGRERSAMLRLLENFLIRRLVANETPKNYNRFFAALARAEVDSYEKLVDVFARSDDPSSRLPSDTDFVEGFTSTYLTNRQAKLVLYLLEGSIRDDSRHSTALASFQHYTLEHVMPKKWRNKWERLPEEREVERDRLVLKLGNLTLLSASLNSSVRDADWATKKSGFAGHGGLSKYGRGLEIFDDDLDQDSWTDDHIRSRGARLGALALNVWPRPAG